MTISGTRGNVMPSVKSSSGAAWDMSQERVFQETTLHLRLNFFLAVFLAIVAGTASAKTMPAMQLILLLGIGITGLLGLVLIRSQHKASKIQRELLKNPCHPYTVINAGAFGSRFYRVKLIGYVIPSTCISILVLALCSTFVSWGLSPRTFHDQSISAAVPAPIPPHTP